MKKLVLILLIPILTISCASVRIELEPNSEQSTSFTHYSHYGLFGLVGSDSIDLKKACMDGEPTQIQNYFSIEDMLFPITIAVAVYSLYWVLSLYWVGLASLGWLGDPLVILSALGLYFPKSTKVWCEIPPAQDTLIKL